MLPSPTEQSFLERRLLDVLIRSGMVALLVLWCYQVLHPFLDLLLWSIILAIALYPLHSWLRSRLGNSDRRAATMIVLLVVITLLVPVYFLGISLAESVSAVHSALESGKYHIPPPVESVAEWPLVGQGLYDLWTKAYTDEVGFVRQLVPQLRSLGLGLLGQITGIGVAFLMFVAAVIIAGIFMAFGQDAGNSAVRIFARISGPEQGQKLAALCTATIRAVAQGVVGIAVIQTLLIGVGFLVKGIPGAGLLALAALFLGIMQLPVALIALPVLGYVFFTEGVTVVTVGFAIYTLIAGLADNVLKPLLLGRGLDVPMPVVLIGALGGVVATGIIGLFVGPVVLAVGYQIFWVWVDRGTT